ncbi:MAG: hypothetical protein FP813_07610 [Desulfurivibrio sp.]|nr:hypothetical protein [Desulfurivibrio sp.]
MSVEELDAITSGIIEEVDTVDQRGGDWDFARFNVVLESVSGALDEVIPEARASVARAESAWPGEEQRRAQMEIGAIQDRFCEKVAAGVDFLDRLSGDPVFSAVILGLVRSRLETALGNIECFDGYAWVPYIRAIADREIDDKAALV